MPHPRFSNEEIVRRGEEIYAARLRERLETEENMGKILVIDIETGDYEIDTDDVAATDRLFDRHPDAQIWMRRVGSRYAYHVGFRPIERPS